MGYTRSAIDVMREFVQGMSFPILIKNVVTAGNIHTLTCDMVYHAQQGLNLTIAGNVYLIKEVPNDFTIVVEGSPAPVKKTEFNLYSPYFFSGTPIDTNLQLTEKKFADKIPMIWMLETYQYDEYPDPKNAVEQDIRCRLYFLTHANHEENLSPELNEIAIAPMRRLKDYFIAKAYETPGLFTMVDFEPNGEVYTKFGVYISNRGVENNMFAENLSGILLEATWRLMKRDDCNLVIKPVCLPCDPVRIRNSDSTYDELEPAGNIHELADQLFTDSNRATTSIPAMTSPLVALPKYEAETQTFIDAAAITDETQQSALNTFIRRLKGANKYSTNIYPLFKAIWPLIGGTALKHSYNLIDPTKFQLAFFGSATHNATGITGDGVTFYADTGWNGITEGADKQNLCFGSYAALGNIASGLGVKDAVTDNFIQLLRRSGSTTFTGRLASSNLALSVPQANAMAMVQRTGNTLEYVQGKDIKQSGTPATLGNLPNLSLFLFTFNNNGVPSTKGTGPFMLFFIAEHLGANEREIFNDAVKEMQVALGRLIESDLKDTDNATLGTAVWGDDATLTLARELIFYFDATATDDMTVTIGTNQKGTYTANSFANVASVIYEKNAIPVSLPFSLTAGDTLKVSITRTTPGQNSQVNITGSY